MTPASKILITLIVAIFAYTGGVAIWGHLDSPSSDGGSGSRNDTTEISRSVCSVLGGANSPEGLRSALVEIRDMNRLSSEEVGNLVSNAITSTCPEHEEAIVGLSR